MTAYRVVSYEKANLAAHPDAVWLDLVNEEDLEWPEGLKTHDYHPSLTMEVEGWLPIAWKRTRDGLRLCMNSGQLPRGVDVIPFMRVLVGELRPELEVTGSIT